MTVELIPVIEVGYHNQGIATPDSYPYWEHPDEWQEYSDKSYFKAGFRDKFKPYSKGSPFHRPKDITDNNLIKIIEDHMSVFKDGDTGEDDLCPLFGGYVLRIDGVDALFPQCCSDLGDWVYWNSIVKNRKSVYYNGHPTPIVKFTLDNVIFNCKDADEDFVPTTNEIIEVALEPLEIALKNMIGELKEFAARIAGLTDRLSFKTQNDLIEDILIFRNLELDIKTLEG